MDMSQRHHYIPQFLIRHFTDDRGLLYVYDKQTEQIVQRSPKAAFYEWNRNTFTLGEQKVDNLEKLYSDLDQEFAANLAKVVSSSEYDAGSLANILLLAMTLKWRTPASDEEFDRLKHNTTMADLGIRIVPKDPSQKLEPEVLQQLINSDLFKEGKRTLLPIQPFLNADKTPNEAKLIELHENCYLHRCQDARYPALLSDCGIIEQAKADYDQLGNFIFPLSSMLTLICKKNPRPYVEDPARFYSCKELIALFTAKRYVGCANKEHLQTLISLYHLATSRPGTEEYLLNALFETV